MNIFSVKAENELLKSEVADLTGKLAEETRVKLELYWLYEALCEKLNQGGWVQVQPPNLSLVRNSQTKS